MAPNKNQLSAEDLTEFLKNLLTAEDELVSATIRGAQDPNLADPKGEILVRPIRLKQQRVLQFAFRQFKKETHRNLAIDEAIELFCHLLATPKSRASIRTVSQDIQIQHLSDASFQLISQATSRQPAIQRHNRQKPYILKEGEPTPFLEKLGIMTSSGKVLPSRYDKFRQVNKFLELVHDILPNLPSNGPISIVDFGSGKAYLTFALYHYFHHIQKRTAHVLGVEMRPELVAECTQLAKELNWPHLHFLCSPIAQVCVDRKPDLVVSLHACDTATDDALALAVKWGAKAILAAPCCQHELFEKLNTPLLSAMLRYGAIRERLAALVTDALRAARLEAAGYSVQIVEFIETQHTPKNLLIRAVRSPHISQEKALQTYIQLRDFWNVHPAIEEKLPVHTIPKDRHTIS